MLTRLSTIVSSAIVALVLTFGPASAQEQDLYAVPNVRVDVTAASAAAARDQALLQGQREALRQLIDRLTLGRGGIDVDALTDEQIGQLLQNFEVQEERASNVRYLGTLTYRFNPSAVQAMLTGAGASFAEQTSPPVLILPVLRTPDSARLWDDPNPWRQVWQVSPVSSPVAPVVVPFGDIEDVAEVSADQALAAEAAALGTIAARYGVDEVLVATIDAAQEELDPAQPLTVSVSRIVPYGPVETGTVTVPPGASMEAQLQEAASAVSGWLEQGWERMAAIGAPESQVTIRIPISGMEEWISLKRQLEGLPQVADLGVEGLARDVATVELSYRGDEDRLRAALAQRGYDLSGGIPSVSMPAPGMLPPLTQAAGGAVYELRPRATPGETLSPILP